MLLRRGKEIGDGAIGSGKASRKDEIKQTFMEKRQTVFLNNDQSFRGQPISCAIEAIQKKVGATQLLSIAHPFGHDV